MSRNTTDPPQERGNATYGEHSSLTYNSYLRVTELTSLQNCLSQHHDEPLFIIIHQTYELWFKLMLHEIDEVMQLLQRNDVRRSTFYLRRVVHILKHLVSQIHVLETMSPRDFLGFRNKLNPASGFQSSQFRELEITCGMRDRRLLEHFRKDELAYPQLLARFEAPSLQDEFYALLRRNGFTLPQVPTSDMSEPESESMKGMNGRHTDAIPSNAPSNERKVLLAKLLDVDVAQSSEVQRAEDVRMQELRKLYESTDQYAELHDLAETLMDLDEQISLWRTHHVTVVERVIGFKRGTGGSEGVGYLRSTLNKRCFPDLWQVRTVLECPSEA